MKHYKLVEFLSNLYVKPPCTNAKPPRKNVKPPYWRLSGDGSGKMSDRSSKSSFAVSRNLKNAKHHFTEAKIDNLTESSDTTPNSVSTSTWLWVTSNMKSTSGKTRQTSLLFLELLQIQNLKRKSGGACHVISPTWKSGEGTSPVPPTKLRP